MTTDSTFYHDGFDDGIQGASASPPDVTVYRAEYLHGWTDGAAMLREHLAAMPFETMRPHGANDINSDYYQ